MKRLWLISFCFAFTFLLGGVAGWQLKPAPRVVVAANTSGATNVNSTVGSRLFRELNDSLALTAAQQAAVRPLCEAWGTKADALGHRPRLKMELFEQSVPHIRAWLTTNQFARFDEYVADARARNQARGR